MLWVGLLSLAGGGEFSLALAKEPAAPPALRPSQQTALETVAKEKEAILRTNKALWEFAEVGLDEKKSSAMLVEQLRQAGFEVQVGIGDMPTAFVASYGFGKPTIGILAEYDALPGLSQKISTEQEAFQVGAAGHGCGHSGLGAGTLGAALAVQSAMKAHKLPGTLQIFGTPAEETVIGKVYLLLDGAFQDLDVCLHWHPGTKNEVWNGSSKALISAKFTFMGTASHAAGSPDKGRSALDGVELMNVGANFMREHLKEDARLHYVTTNGGGQPNVVPPEATVWYYIRSDNHEDAVAIYRWLHDVAKGASLMSRTTYSVQVETDCHELFSNQALAEVFQNSLQRQAPPQFTEDELAFARRLQITYESADHPFTIPLEAKVQSLATIGERSKGSTDVGDISWFVPTCGLRTACFPIGAPGHSWQNVASIGSTIGEKGIVYAAEVLSLTALDLLETPKLVAAARAEFQEKMKSRKYTTLIPDGQKPPRTIR